MLEKHCVRYSETKYKCFNFWALIISFYNFKFVFTDSKHLVQRITLETVLDTHQGCVNSVHWNDTGSLLLTAGDDKHIVITNPFTYKVYVDYKTKHKSNIFCAKFLPTTDSRIISCGGDGSILNLGTLYIFLIV